MRTVRRELESLDRLEIPISWSDVLHRAPQPSPPGPPRRRAPVVVVALLLAAASLVLAVWALRPDRAPVPAASDQRQIAFVRGGDVYLMNPDGTSVRKLAEGPASGLAWSPDGRLLAFARSELVNEGVITQIYVVRPDGGGLRRITSAPPPGAYFPMWSPDGTRIAFYGPFQGRPSQLIVMALDGSEIRSVPLPFQSTAFATNPVLSPDFRQIAFSMCRGRPCAPQIYVRPRAGGALAQLTEVSPGVAIAPAWSPSGQQIAFIHDVNYRSRTVVVMNADGTDQTVVHRCEPQYCLSVSWSPDGDHLLVSETGKNPDACRLLPIDEMSFEGFTRICLEIPSTMYVTQTDGSGSVPIGSGGLWATRQPSS